MNTDMQYSAMAHASHCTGFIAFNEVMRQAQETALPYHRF